MLFKKHFDTFGFGAMYILNAFSRLDIHRLSTSLKILTHINVNSEWIHAFYAKEDFTVIDNSRLSLRTTNQRTYLEIQTFDFPIIEFVERSVNFAPLEKTGSIGTPIIIDPRTLEGIIYSYAEKRDKGVEKIILFPQSNQFPSAYVFKERIRDRKKRIIGNKPGHYVNLITADPASLEVSCSSTANELTFAEINSRLEHVYFDLMNLGVFNPNYLKKR